MQKELKLVLFNPTEDRFAVDIYLNGTRVHCGRGFVREETAWLEAMQYMRVENILKCKAA